jgi:hypothetical protein
MPVKQKKTLEEKQAAMSARQTAKHQLSRKDALEALSAEIANLEDGDPRKGTLLARYLAAKPARKRDRNQEKESAVRSAIRNREVVEMTDDRACDAYNKWAPAERQAWRLMWALDELRDGHNTANHDVWGGPTTPEERATATLIHEGKLQPIGYGFDLHHEGFQVFDTVDEGLAAAEQHKLDCSTCRNRDQFFYHDIYPEPAR